MKFSYHAVDRIPRELQPGIVYHSEEFELAGLLCACGCGHRITLLVPDSHQVLCEDGLATIRPSIAVCDGECKSHYVISAGHVDWLEAFSGAEAASLMQAQIVRHAVRDARPVSWTGRLVRAARRFIDRIRSILKK